ncbi:hypothetical protein DE146DRAFT_787832 [Phaeosphaeria sp. MPI-PUGE-AT-0046c]|nr:hypothetical protein DE146DRAFT_787832 [Phaeosphaeria sp. MPI-PUGE-AT-0046c]
MVRRSRVQFRGPPAKKNKRIDKARTDHYFKPTSLLSQQFASKQPQAESLHDSEAATTTGGEPPSGTQHVNNDQETEAEMFVFPKITLASKGMCDKRGGTHVQAHESHETTVPALPPLRNSSYESPPASWVKLAPIYDRRRAPLLPSLNPEDFLFHDTGRTTPESKVEPCQGTQAYHRQHASQTLTPKPTSRPGTQPSPTARSRLEIIVQLFAGRKQRPRSTKQKARAEQGPPRSDSDTSSDQTEPSSISDSSPPTEPPQSPSPCFQPSILTHAQVIPGVVKHNPSKLRRPYVYVSPAPFYIDTGKAFSTENLYEADIVHRGFNTRVSADHVVAGHKRNHSAGQYLDREGDVWANWYAKCNTVDSDPPRHTSDSMIW